MDQTTLGSRSWAAPIQHRPFFTTSMGIVQGTASSQRDRTGPQGWVSCIAGCVRFFTLSQCLQSGQGPLFSRTLVSAVGMSALGHKPTSAYDLATSACRATLLHSVKKREDFSSDAQALSHFGYSICRSALLGHSRLAEARHVNRSRSKSQMGRRTHEGRSRPSPSDLSLSTRLELRGAG